MLLINFIAQMWKWRDTVMQHKNWVNSGQTSHEADQMFLLFSNYTDVCVGISWVNPVLVQDCSSLYILKWMTGSKSVLQSDINISDSDDILNNNN